ncbi:MAG: translational machinery protein [Polyangiaceae bacterium]
MSTYHAAVWIDHKEAKIFHLTAEGFNTSTFEAPRHHVHRHQEATAEKEHPADSTRFYHEVARALEEVKEILVVGPATAKLEFIKHVHKHDRSLVDKIVGVETVDHPTDNQLVAHARRYFRAADKMRG